MGCNTREENAQDLAREEAARRNPYEVYEAVCGKYNPDIPPKVIYSVWFSEQKAVYLEELQRFFRWLDDRFPPSEEVES